MAKKALIAIFLIFTVLTPVFAGFDFNFGTAFDLEVSKTFGEDGTDYPAHSEAYAQVSYEEENLKAEVRGQVSMKSEEEVRYSFERIYASYRINDFGKNTVTVKAGLFPSDWGLGGSGSFHIGNIINSQNEDYMISALQSFDDGWSVDAAAVLPVFTTNYLRLGAQGRKTFDNETFKEARVSVVYDFEKNLNADAGVQIKTWADITAGVALTYDFEEKVLETGLIAYAEKSFPVSTDKKTYNVKDSLGLAFILSNGKNPTFLIEDKADVEITGRTTAVAEVAAVFAKGITNISLTGGAEFKIEEGLKARTTLTFTHEGNSNCLSAKVSLKYAY